MKKFLCVILLSTIAVFVIGPFVTGKSHEEFFVDVVTKIQSFPYKKFFANAVTKVKSTFTDIKDKQENTTVTLSSSPGEQEEESKETKSSSHSNNTGSIHYGETQSSIFNNTQGEQPTKKESANNDDKLNSRKIVPIYSNGSPDMQQFTSSYNNSLDEGKKRNDLMLKRNNAILAFNKMREDFCSRFDSTWQQVSSRNAYKVEWNKSWNIGKATSLWANADNRISSNFYQNISNCDDPDELLDEMKNEFIVALNNITAQW